ncbi:Reverse transcriptase-like [Sesbania bispinosa]|nr:Reverse transcriptase-like [Sesbania bispinosa]
MGFNQTPIGTLIRATTLTNDCLGVIGRRDQTNSNPRGIQYPQVRKPSKQGIFKFNTDVAFREQTNRGATAVVARDNMGEVIARYTKKNIGSLHSKSGGFVQSDALGYKPQSVGSGDGERLTDPIKACKNEHGIGEIHHIIINIPTLKRNKNCSFTWVKRRGNEMDHQATTMVAYGLLNTHWVTFPPSPSNKSYIKTKTTQS